MSSGPPYTPVESLSALLRVSVDPHGTPWTLMDKWSNKWSTAHFIHLLNRVHEDLSYWRHIRPRRKRLVLPLHSTAPLALGDLQVIAGMVVGSSEADSLVRFPDIGAQAQNRGLLRLQC